MSGDWEINVAVTGATGFIGKVLCRALEHSGLSPRPISLRAPNEVPVLDGVDMVLHLAAIAHQRAADPESLRRVNVELAVRMGHAAAGAGCRMIFMSSVKVHGEESSTPVRETSPFAPGDVYGDSKARAEEALRTVPGLRLTVLRPPLVYGPEVKANFLALVKAIDRGIPLPLATVKNRRSLVYAENLADAVLCCMRSDKSVGRAYLVSDGPSVSTPELCRAIGTAFGRTARLWRFPPALVELLPGAKRLTRSLEVDDSAIRRELAWQPRHSLAEGLQATAQWYRGR